MKSRGFLLLMTAGMACAQIQVIGMGTSSDFTSSLPATGSLASIFVKGLTGITGVVQASGSPVPDTLAGVSVTIYGSPAPILAIADVNDLYGHWQQINIQIPLPPPGQTGNGPLILVTQSGETGAGAAPGFYGQWGVFFADAKKNGVLQHADYSLVTAANPARPGEMLVAYATNLADYDSISNAPAIGMPAGADPLPRVDQPGLFSYYANVNGVRVETPYVGLSPGLIGVFQVNFVVPSSIGPSLATLQMIGFPSCFGFGALCPNVKQSNVITFPVGIGQ
ncbi:MAG TPA: hypothetical protein VGN17_06535 [Bryobacteraceae bacterium]|jgi:uncharacterized protein (TIGR03437 family)